MTDTDQPETPPETSSETQSETAQPGTAQPGTPARTAWLLPAALIAIAVALFVAGAIFLVRAGDADDSGASSNEALVNRTATTEVIGQVSTALNQVLSYDFQKPQTAEAAAKRWLTGDAIGQYRQLLQLVTTQAKGQQLVLVAKVNTAGVTTLRGDRAQLLVFLDQQSTRVSDGKSSLAAAQVQIAAVKHGSTWQIDQIKVI